MLSDQKHENAGEAAAASGRNNESKYGQWKTTGTKGLKSGHCELQRTTRGKVPWISSLGKHQDELKEREKEREREREYTRILSNTEASIFRRKREEGARGRIGSATILPKNRRLRGSIYR